MDGRHIKRGRNNERVRTTGIDKLGEKEYMKLLQEVDLMTQTPVNIEELINKRMKEIEERLVAEEQEKEAAERRETRSQANKASTSMTTDLGAVPAQRSSLRKRKTDAEPKKDTGDKRSKTDDTDDASKNRKPVGAKRPKQKKTDAIPMLMDDDEDDLMVMDDKDKDYGPQLEEDDNDMYPMDNDDDDNNNNNNNLFFSVVIVIMSQRLRCHLLLRDGRSIRQSLSAYGSSITKYNFHFVCYFRCFFFSIIECNKRNIYTENTLTLCF